MYSLEEEARQNVKASWCRMKSMSICTACILYMYNGMPGVRIHDCCWYIHKFKTFPFLRLDKKKIESLFHRHLKLPAA